MMLPKFFVVTMSSGENDFEHCIEAVKRQRNVEIVHNTITGYSEIDAHNIMYEMFNECDPNCVRAKIDADMVLVHDNVFEIVAHEFISNKNIEEIDCGLHDYLTDTIMSGMHFYSRKVRFNRQTDTLFCDRNITVPKQTYVKALTNPYLATHMHFCSERSAFRYGFHRALKKQHNVLKNVLCSWKRTGDRRMGFALLGAMCSLTTNQHNYTDDLFDECFLKSLRDYNELIKQIDDISKRGF